MADKPQGQGMSGPEPSGGGRKVFVFLQGPPSVFCRRVADELDLLGHRTHRINLCPGDWLAWHDRRAVNYRGSLAGFKDWLREFVRKVRATDIVYYADRLPYHVAAAEIADELGLHESTISRVTTAKYMATPFGTFELKYFFGSGLGTETGGNASSTAVRALIKQFISAESSAKPLSDNQISEMLKEQGIECARRTVAKYREGLKIAPASLRKAL